MPSTIRFNLLQMLETKFLDVSLCSTQWSESAVLCQKLSIFQVSPKSLTCHLTLVSLLLGLSPVLSMHHFVSWSK